MEEIELMDASICAIFQLSCHTRVRDTCMILLFQYTLTRVWYFYFNILFRIYCVSVYRSIIWCLCWRVGVHATLVVRDLPQF